MSVEVAVLGPVEVVVDGEPTALEVPKERALLSALALRAGRAAPVDELVAALWGEDPPATAGKTLQGYVSGLRKLAGPEAVVTQPRGYALGLEREAVDLWRFEDLVSAGIDAARAGEPGRAVHELSAALGLWTPAVLADLADGPFRAGHVARLDELRLAAIEARIDAQLSLGHHDNVIGDLELLVAEHPLREPLWAQLMVALYRSGRQADALNAYRRLRSHLTEELGIEPGHALQRLESRVLRQDDGLELEAPAPGENLPSPLTSFVGRSDDRRELDRLLDEHRLVTLVGPGGVGKTRLALEGAWRRLGAYGDGIWWLDLASVRDAADVAARLAAALGAPAAPGMTMLDAVLTFVRHRELLLVLDNCEHVVDEISRLTHTVLEAGPAVSVLATSRMPLAVTGEYLYPLDPLAVPPDDDGDPLAFDAVRLFTVRAEERSRRGGGDGSLPLIAGICRRLDGLPLAIEVAAARSRHFAPGQILERLDDRLGLLGHDVADVDPRHRSLRTAFDWSYELLAEDDRAAFDRLGVFPGDFDLEAFVAVTGGGETDRATMDRLARLVDASMVSMSTDASGLRRYRLLETIRDYTRDHLDDATGMDAARRHADHFRALARRADEDADGPDEHEWAPVLDREDHNLRAAIAWSLNHQDRATTLEFASPVGLAYYNRGDMTGCLNLVGTILEGADEAPPRLRAWALYRLIWPAFLSGEHERAFAVQAEVLDLFRTLAEPAGIGYAMKDRGHMILLGLGDVDEALRWQHEAIEATQGTSADWQRAHAQVCAAHALAFGDRPETRADTYLDDAARVVAGNPFVSGHIGVVRALLALARDDPQGAETIANGCIEQCHRDGIGIWEQAGWIILGISHLCQGDLAAAETDLHRAARLALDVGNLFQLGLALHPAAALAAGRGDPVSAARLEGASSALATTWPLYQRLFEPFIAVARVALGEQWDQEVQTGAALSPDRAVDLVVGPPPA